MITTFAMVRKLIVFLPSLHCGHVESQSIRVLENTPQRDLGALSCLRTEIHEAWHVVSFIAGEMKRPQLDLPRSLFYGSTMVMLVYVAANLGYYRVLSATEIRLSDGVAALAVGREIAVVARFRYWVP